MLDIKFIREHPDKLKEALKKRGSDFNVDHFLAVDVMRRERTTRLDELRKEHNVISEAVAKLDASLRAAKIDESKMIKEKITRAEEELKKAEDEFTALMLTIPNIPADDVPTGGEAENKILRSWGEPKKFSFPPKDHVALGEALDVIDIERASRVSGSRFGYLKGEVALLEFALIQFVFSHLTNKEIVKKIADAVEPGYAATMFMPVVPPQMIKPEVFTRMARLSEADKEERYYFPKDDLYLIGSAEHTLGPLHMDETVDEGRLPIRYLGFSTSFRREAGSYGRDTRGILRVHQFDKIEVESFTRPEDGQKEQEFFVRVQEHLVRELGIPHRVLLLATGEMGGPDVRQVDIECWMPGQGKYRETHTADYMGDYQARRLNTRVRHKDGKTEFVHMNDATIFAIGRIIIALLENYQEADGSIEIPEALLPYMHGITKIKR